jgi:hypothetical protein
MDTSIRIPITPSPCRDEIRRECECACAAEEGEAEAEGVEE